MGFFDVLSKVGKSFADKMVKQQIEMWDALRKKSFDTQQSFYDRNNSEDKNNSSLRAIALLSMPTYEALQLLRNDERALRQIKNLADKVALDDSYISKQLNNKIEEILDGVKNGF